MFETKTAPNYWQRIINRILKNLTGVACFFDNTEIKGSDLKVTKMYQSSFRPFQTEHLN